MRNMSFGLTERQFYEGKDVTRRLGWKFLKPGDRLRAVRKSMGLRKGEKVHPLGIIEIVSVRRESIQTIKDYPANEVAREGFPEMTPDDLIQMFCREMKCKLPFCVTRIEFRRIA